MKIVSTSLFVIFSLHAFSQIKNVKNYDDLIKIQNTLKSESESIVVWGHFRSWGKFGWDSYKNICPGVLKKSDYSGLLSGLTFTLFSDSTTTYFLPIKKDAKIYRDFTIGEIIKLKVKLYKDCKMIDNKIYFLIEEIL